MADEIFGGISYTSSTSEGRRAVTQPFIDIMRLWGYIRQQYICANIRNRLNRHISQTEVFSMLQHCFGLVHAPFSFLKHPVLVFPSSAFSLKLIFARWREPELEGKLKQL